MLLALSACSTPDPVNVTGRDGRPGPGGHDAGAVWDGSFEDDGGGIVDECGAPPVSNEAFSRAGLIGAAADCATWHYCRFESAARSLRDKSHALESEASEAALEDARNAWRHAMLAWSSVELFQFGPVAPKTADKDPYHGKGIRNLVYAWPRMGRCQVEEQVALQRFLTDGVGKVLINGRGLFASEYLLFYPGDDHDCSPSSQTASAWASFEGDELAKRKRLYAKAIADDVLEQGRQIVDFWSPTGGNFRQKLLGADQYGNDQEVLNVIAWSLIYIEREVKDWKLGIPAGYTAAAPVDGPESRYAGIGNETIRANLRGFRSLFQGCGHEGEGLGFDDWLTAAGHAELAEDIVKAWEEAQAVADAFPQLHAASADEIETFYQAVKELTDLLKADLFGPGSPLNLKLPATLEGDTD